METEWTERGAQESGETCFEAGAAESGFKAGVRVSVVAKKRVTIVEPRDTGKKRM